MQNDYSGMDKRVDVNVPWMLSAWECGCGDTSDRVPRRPESDASKLLMTDASEKMLPSAQTDPVTRLQRSILARQLQTDDALASTLVFVNAKRTEAKASIETLARAIQEVQADLRAILECLRYTVHMHAILILSRDLFHALINACNSNSCSDHYQFLPSVGPLSSRIKKRAAIPTILDEY